MRGQLFSEDGSEMVEDRAVFDCGESKAPDGAGALAARQGARIDPEAVLARMRRVLVLRPEPGASATVERARERGLDAVAIPLFEIEPLAWEAPEAGSFDGLLLTSANAVRHGGEGLASLRGLQGLCGRRSDRRRRARGRVRHCRDRRCGRRPAARLDRAGPEAAASLRRRPARAGRRSAADHARFRSIERRRSRSPICRRAVGPVALDPLAARRARASPSWSADRSVDRDRGDQRRRGRGGGVGLASGRSCRRSRPTTRCWPSRHGCATTREPE